MVGCVVLDVAAAALAVADVAVLLVLALRRAVHVVRVAVLTARVDVGDAVFLALLDVHFAHVGRACAHFLCHPPLVVVGASVVVVDVVVVVDGVVAVEVVVDGVVAVVAEEVVWRR